jgi:glycine hydroxymethyltransferase
MMIDVTPLGVNGKEAEHLLDEIGVTVNRNSIPFDKLPLTTGSGIRLGTPATTSRGFREPEMRLIGETIVSAIVTRDDPSEQAKLAAQMHDLCSRFPVPGLRED